LSVGALVATLVHMTGIAFDEFIDFDAAAVLVPGRAPWKPMAVAWGVAAFYGMVVVILSFYIRKHIGQSTWRSLHYLSFGVFVSALVHGLTAGTDTANPWVFALYAATGAAVVALVVLRVVMAGLDGSKGEPARAPRAARSTTPGAHAELAPDDAPAAPAAVPPAAKQRIPEHLLARARAAKAAAGQAADDPGQGAEPVLVGASTTEAAQDRAASRVVQPGDGAPRKSRIPAEALAKAAELRKARDGGGG
jgi:hypothetical protein